MASGRSTGRDARTARTLLARRSRVLRTGADGSVVVGGGKPSGPESCLECSGSGADAVEGTYGEPVVLGECRRCDGSGMVERDRTLIHHEPEDTPF